MKDISNTIESLIEELYDDFPDEEVDKILNNTSRKISADEFEKMDSSIKKVYEHLDFSKKPFEERKKIACGIYIQELIEQTHRNK